MDKVSLEDSEVLAQFSSIIGSVKGDMQDNLTGLRNDFDIACEQWKDANAQAIAKALDEHTVAMRAQIDKLQNFENTIRQLARLAGEYEDI